MDQVTEMFVSPLVSLLIENLAPLALSFIHSGGIDRKLEEWTNLLVMIEAVLEDAEDRQLTQKPIQLWLQDVQKLAFEIEDLLDDLATEAQRRQMIATPESSRSDRLRKFTSRFDLAIIRFSYDMDRKIGKISNSLQQLEKRKNILNLQKFVGGKSERAGDMRLPLTSSLVGPARICGREEDSAAILTWLLEEDNISNHDGKVRIVSIVGMGGIGKTTLAQSLYNNEEVEGCFHDRVWVCVTENFDVFRICKIIYENLFGKSCGFHDLNMVQQKLREKISNKKFLLVLDDVWNQDYSKWYLLCSPFHGGAPGSTIIITTRSQDVAKTMGSEKVYDLKKLSDGDCLSLLAQHAFEKQNFDEHPEFEEVGKVIAGRCKGLPLAAKSLGGLLRTKGSLKQWREVSTSKIWELQSNGIMPALRLSYHHLPPHLKPLFAFCSLFPKAYEFDQRQLIMLWMSQGLLRESEGQKQMEELGCEYFIELLSSSFFQHSTRNESRFVMHDLNNDLAQLVAGIIYLRLDAEMESNEQYKVSEQARHASFISQEYDDFRKVKAFDSARCMRTILPIREESLDVSYISSLVIKDFPRFPCLRALSFNGYCMSELPKSIDNLNHLRYLDLSRTNIKELPKAVCGLSNLQTLLLHGCRELVQLPKSIRKLINLRHLDIVDTQSLLEMPLGIGMLTHLRTLSKFIIDNRDRRKITELKGLHHLQGTLSITSIENVMDVQFAIEANLLRKKGLHGLEMKWSGNFGGTREVGLEFEVLDALKPPTGLASLEIEFSGGHKFPSWIGDRSFCDMVKVRLIGCKYCTTLPPLGQLTLLKELFIEGMGGVKVVGSEFLGTKLAPNIVAFRSLINLSFTSMDGWEEWFANPTYGDENVKGAFPCLQHLKINGCMKLNKVSLPKIPSLESLEVSCCSEKVLRSMVGVGSVKKLKVYGISGLSKLDEGIIGCLGKVENLEVSGCQQLRCLWEEEVACHVLEKLKSLSVQHCQLLESLGDDEQLLPHNLERLKLWMCDKLEKMPDWQNNLTSLMRLKISSCKQLQDNLASTTPELRPKIEHQGSSSGNHGEYDFSNLKSVNLTLCTSLKRFPTGKKLPTCLTALSVNFCENMDAEVGEKGTSLSLLESISFTKCSNLLSLPQGFAHLTRLNISSCSGIESIPERSLPPTLITLRIIECRNLKYILCSNEMQSLTSLRSLLIVCCENLEGFPSGGRWPPNLEFLTMGDVKQPIQEWGLSTLPTSLLTLILVGEFPEVVSFLEVGAQLPTSLTRLETFLLKNLESLREGLENLSSLQHLRIHRCVKLQKLPETLLPTLSSLDVFDCPLLEERCKKEKRDYWPKISHIPCIKIDDKLMWGL